MIIQYHGHSCLQITTGEHSLIVDPFITGNPAAQVKAEDIRVQYILLTHAHSDHVGDAVELAKRNDAIIVAPVELAIYLGWQGARTLDMNIGGTISLPFGKAKMTHAFHSSSIVQEDKQIVQYMGMPSGYVLTIEGKSLYVAGDTGLFSDMKLIGERHKLAAAFLPIGDHYTMGPDDALAAAEWLRADAVVPVHYNTFPPIRQDAGRFVADLQARGLGGKLLEPGESWEL